MQPFALELIIDAKAEKRPRDQGVPHELLDYARAFHKTGRQSIRFLWRDADRWLNVHLSRRSQTASDVSAKRQDVRLRLVEVQLPRGITPREVEVLTLTSLGLTNQGIAERLGTSARTVSTQVERLLVKLDQSTRGGLAALAVDSGLLKLPIPGGFGTDLIAGLGIVELEMAVAGRLEPHRAISRPQTPEKAPILIGLLMPNLDNSADGIELLRGATLALEEINESGGFAGRPLVLVDVSVDLFDWESVRQGFEQLFEQGVHAIIENYVSAEHKEVLELVADYGRPFLHTATFGEQVALAEANPIRYGMILQTCASETHYGAGLFRLLAELEQGGNWLPKTRKLGILELDVASARLVSDEFRDLAAKNNWEISSVVQTPLGTTDWPKVISEVTAGDPDVILVTNFLDDELASFQENFVELGGTQLVYCIYAPSIPRFQQRLGSKADGVIWSTTTGTYNDELGHKFRVNFERRFGVAPGWSQAGSAYDRVRLLAAAWSAVDPTNVNEVIRYMRRWPYRGVNGVYYFGDTAHTTLLYPDQTSDASIGQAHMIYQMWGNTHRVLGPTPYGSTENFALPPWSQAL